MAELFRDRVPTSCMMQELAGEIGTCTLGAFGRLRIKITYLLT